MRLWKRNVQGNIVGTHLSGTAPSSTGKTKGRRGRRKGGSDWAVDGTLPEAPPSSGARWDFGQSGLARPSRSDLCEYLGTRSALRVFPTYPFPCSPAQLHDHRLPCGPQRPARRPPPRFDAAAAALVDAKRGETMLPGRAGPVRPHARYITRLEAS